MNRTGLIEEAHVSSTEKSDMTGDGERPIRVLVVDDEPLIVQMLTIALTYEKYEVSVARDGIEAIRLACLTRPDLVILDVMMPNMDGIEVARKLRDAGD